MKIGDLRMHDVVVDVLPFRRKIDQQREAAGLLGFDFLDDARCTIDYAAGYRRRDFSRGVRSPIRRRPTFPYVSAGSSGSLALDRCRERRQVRPRHRRATLTRSSFSRHFVRQNESDVSDSAKRARGALVTRDRRRRSRTLARPVARSHLRAVVHLRRHGRALARPVAGYPMDGLIGSDFLDNFA